MFTLHNDDCLQILPTIPSGSIDAIITDLPYGTTACKWDTVIEFAPMWKEVKRVLKPNGAFITTASQPFTSALIMSNVKMFKYCWVWDKVRAVGAHTSKIRCMQRTEDVVVFGTGKIKYNPILTPREKIRVGGKEYGRTEIIGGKTTGNNDGKTVYTHYQPTNVIVISNASNKGRLHPTQKPVALYEYLIKTYTNEGDTILDIAMGSGTTIEAAERTGRNSIGIEKDEGIFQSAVLRLKSFTPSNNASTRLAGKAPASNPPAGDAGTLLPIPLETE